MASKSKKDAIQVLFTNDHAKEVERNMIQYLCSGDPKLKDLKHLDLFTAYMFNSSKIIPARELRNRDDFIKVEGSDSLGTLSGLNKKLGEKIHELEGKDFEIPYNYTPLILSGVTGLEVSIALGEYKIKASVKNHEVCGTVRTYLVHRVEGENLVIDVYVRDYFPNGVIVPTKQLNRKMDMFLLGTLETKLADIDLTSKYSVNMHTTIIGDAHIQTVPNLDRNSSENFKYRRLYPEDIKSMIKVGMVSCLTSKDREGPYTEYFFQVVWYLFCSMNRALNLMRYYQVLYREKQLAEMKSISEAAITAEHAKSGKPKKTTSNKQKEPERSTVVLNLDCIENLDKINKLMKAIDHNINHTVNYSVSEWQVMGYVKRLRNGKLHYFPPSVRHRRAVQLDVPLRKTKNYVVSNK